MPRIDVNGVDCRNDKIASKGFIIDKNHYDSFQIESTTKTPTDGKFHSPKVFAADSITVNAPAKHVLGSKFDTFAKHSKQSIAMPAESSVLPKTNGTTNGSNGHLVNGTNGTINGNAAMPKLQPLSACYDRYPKPGSYGSLQVFPMNGVNSEINNAKENIYGEMSHIYRNKEEKKNELDLKKLEQDRLEEILRMCADFERQNQNVQSSPIVQNRIKTNGSLPREKKSPLSPEHIGATTNVFFPPSPVDFHQQNLIQKPSSPHAPHKTHTGYENVRLLAARKIEMSSPSSRFENSSDSNATAHMQNGYENVMSPLKSPVGYVPQSPRTRIKTCISPKKELTSTPIQRKTDYDLLVRSFEEKLRMEIQQLHDNRNADNRIHLNNWQGNQKSETVAQMQMQTQQHSTNVSLPTVQQQQAQQQHVNRSTNLQEGIYGTLTNKPKSNNHLTVNIKKNLDEKQIAQLKKQQIEVLRKARELKAQIAELQRQEEEVLREVILLVIRCDFILERCD